MQRWPSSRLRGPLSRACKSACACGLLLCHSSPLKSKKREKICEVVLMLLNAVAAQRQQPNALQRARNQFLHYFIRAAVDALHAGVGEHAAHQIFVHVTVTAV